MKTFHEVGIPLEALLENLGNLICVFDVSGRIEYANQQLLNTLDYPEASLNSMEDVVTKFSLPLFEGALADVTRLHQAIEVELHVHTRRGHLKVLYGSLVPYHQANGDLILATFRDVTALRKSEIEMEHMFEMSVDMLGIISRDGIFRKLNPAWEAALGYSRDELVGDSLLDYVHVDDREATVQQIENAYQMQKILVFENRYRRKDGTYRWLSWHSAPFETQDNIYFVARDITDRKASEQRLRATRDQLQAIIDNSGTFISMKSMDGEYLLVNQEFANRFAASDKSKVIGLKDEDIFPAEFAPRLLQNDRIMLDSGVAMQFEEQLPDVDGRHTYLATKFALRDENGEAYAVCAIATDITYRKLTEMQLLLRNQAIEFSPSGISIADATLPDMPLIYINPAFEKSTGYSALDSIGRNCRFLQADDRDQPELDVLRDALRREDSCTVILRNYRKDGSLFYNELSLAPIHDENGRLTHYVGISTDVTDRVQAESKIQEQNEALVGANQELAIARKQAEDATRLKSQFLATMSHELRTPLNAIIGYTEIQLAGMTGEITEEQRDYQERVLANADHLLELINDVLDIAKIEAGRLEIVNKAFNLPEWVADVTAQIEGLVKGKALSFDVELDPRMPDIIVGDPARIKQLAINLLSNAFKFTHEGSVRLQLRKHGRDAWKLIVSDTGLGIPSHMQETIFEEFRQVDSGSQRSKGGTGLGLSIVRKLTLMMGGNVRLKSQVGEGSTFTVILPLVEEIVPVHYDRGKDKK